MAGNLENAEIAVDALSIWKVYIMTINSLELIIPLAFFAATGDTLSFFLSSPTTPSDHTTPPALRRLRHRLNHHHRHPQALNPCDAPAL
ncbi:hypothetical protein Fmac_001426 [Flemingia macrophylla]|uniref:Uncharacterized protein n=1 Tax=Flemingia macrophylla TaxID=520843 RepID=A0ABD1NH24_9FABA